MNTDIDFYGAIKKIVLWTLALMIQKREFGILVPDQDTDKYLPSNSSVCLAARLSLILIFSKLTSISLVKRINTIPTKLPPFNRLLQDVAHQKCIII